MLRFLLDAHLSPGIARQLVTHRPELEAAALRNWQAGAHLQAEDAEILRAAAEAGWTLVTFDLRTIPTLLVTWGELGVSHGGVIFVDEHTFASNDIGGLVRALIRVWDAHSALDWTNRTLYLTR